MKRISIVDITPSPQIKFMELVTKYPDRMAHKPIKQVYIIPTKEKQYESLMEANK